MNTRIKNFAGIALVILILLATACKGKTQESNEAGTEQIEQTEETAKLGKEYTAAYVCPMHCEGSGSDEEGTCPKCGMAYVANEEHTKDGHKHE
ncbi:MAG: hypothetical protein HKP60_05465 [Eudoraea sp.]|nr:hypothetical protein [Eudoraea sp.]NNJ40299.1 hypothetical protein [Eudoraea sp.]